MTINYISVATYLRIKLPSLLPDHDKVLYLDADLLVLDDITEIFKYHTDEMAVFDVVDPLLNNG